MPDVCRSRGSEARFGDRRPEADFALRDAAPQEERMTCSIIVTDLTPYGKGGLLYVTGVDMATGQNVRPLPYLSERACIARGILPGAVLEMDGEFYGAPPLWKTSSWSA